MAKKKATILLIQSYLNLAVGAGGPAARAAYTFFEFRAGALDDLRFNGSV